MDEAKKLVVNVVTWNHASYIPHLLASLDAQDTDDFTVTVVDNASSDGIVNWLQANRPDVAVLRNFRNQGFARAHNQAIALALSRWDEASLSGRYVLVTNPDLEFSAEAIRLLIAYMDEHTDVAACGPKLLRAYREATGDEDRFDVRRSTVIDSTGLLITKARRVVDRGAGEEDQGQYDGAIDVFGLSGACVLFRASALVGARHAGEFFDEDMFAYQEDVDVAWRMRRMGYIAHYVPHVTVWHHRRIPSLPQGSWFRAWLFRRTKPPFINFLSTRNHLWVLVKNDEWINAFLQAPWWLPYEIAKCFANLLSWSALKGEVQALWGLPKMLAKRREIAPFVKMRGKDLRKWFV